MGAIPGGRERNMSYAQAAAVWFFKKQDAKKKDNDRNHYPSGNTAASAEYLRRMQNITRL